MSARRTSSGQTITKAKWWPVSVVEKRCDCGRYRCTRTGLPLAVAKADTIHSLQGLTVGDFKAIKRLLIHWEFRAEKQFPGALYVAGSRTQDQQNVALSNPICENDLSFDRTQSAMWRAQTAEMKRIQEAAFAARRRAPCEVDAYRDMIVNLKSCDHAILAQLPGKNRDDEWLEMIRACAVQWRNSAAPADMAVDD